MYSAELLQFQWAGQPSNVVPQTSFYDFTGLQLRVKLATLRATLQNRDMTTGGWRHINDSSTLHAADGWCLFYTGFEEQVRLVCSDLGPPGSYTGYTTFEYRYDNLKSVEGPLDGVLLVLLVEELGYPSTFPRSERGRTTETYRMNGLDLEPAEGHATWKRVGSWTASINRHYDMWDNRSPTRTKSIVHKGRKSLVILIHVNASTNNRQNEELASERSKKRRLPCFCDSRA
jgi:hypothetical protein